MIEKLLPSILRHENISRIADGGVYITDRRALPFSHEEVFCPDYHAAARAVKEMVTQGGGPLEAALNTVLLTSMTDPSSLDDAVSELSSARPTNTTMKRELESVMRRYRAGEDMEEIIPSVFRRYDALYDRISDIGAGLIEDGMGILTTCFPEHTFMLSMAKAMKNGKKVTVYVPETRPYLQGARLTEPCLRELGIECYLITDGMGAHFMREGRIQLYMTAADLVLRDRTVVNKTGTLANAVAAAYYSVPYYAFSLGFGTERNADEIKIEYRDGESVKHLGSERTAANEAAALYPCFDIIDPSLVAGIIMDGGIF